MNTTSSQKPAVATVAIIAVSAVVASVVVSQVVKALLGTGRSTASVEHVLVQTTEEMNRKLPMMVDEFTRIDSTIALPNRKLLYRYTILHMEPLPDRETIINSMRPQTLATYKTSAQMAELRQMKVTLIYSYSDEKGNELARFEISPRDIE